MASGDIYTIDLILPGAESQSAVITKDSLIINSNVGVNGYPTDIPFYAIKIVDENGNDITEIDYNKVGNGEVKVFTKNLKIKINANEQLVLIGYKIHAYTRITLMEL